MPETPAAAEQRIRYARGTGRLVLTGSVCALLPDDCADALVEVLWQLQAPDLLVVARVLLAEAPLPDDFAIAVTGTSTAQVLLRGAAVARSGSQTLSADGATTWRESTLPLEGLALQLTSDATPASLPLAGGVVSAHAVAWDTGSSMRDTAVGSALAAPAVPSVPVSIAEDVAEPAPQSCAEDLSDPVSAHPVGLSETLRPDDLPQLGAHEVPTSEGEPVEDEVDPVAPSDGTAPESDDDSYDRLFGATEHVSRRAATRSLDDDAPPTLIAPVAQHPRDGAVIDTPEPAPVRADVPPAAPLISSVPGTLGPLPASPPPEPVPTPARVGVATAAPSAPAAVPVSLDDVSGLTIARSALGSLRGSDGPLVHGVHCPGGHANPVEAVVCRVCGIEVPSQSATTLPRPPLGALVAEQVPPGAPTRVALDGPLLLGRRPTLDGQSGPVPTLVTVASPDNDLSRNHLRINLDGWHVLVTDLGSTNGTVVELPGEQPERIHPQRPTMITPGTRVTLADVATYIYEVTA